MAEAQRLRNRRGEGERLRASLLRAASELLETTRDVDGLSVRAVTAAAGVSPTALYLQFADKDELVRAVKVQCFADLSTALTAALAARPDPVAGLRAMAHAYLAYAREHPGHYAIIFHTGARNAATGSPPPDEVRVAGMAVLDMFTDVAARCLPAGTGRTQGVRFAREIWLALHGRATIEHAMPWLELPDEDAHITRLVSNAHPSATSQG